MRVTAGTVVNGKIEIAGEQLAEGTVVTVLAPEERETFRLDAQAEAALLAAVAEAERGEVIAGAELLQELHRD